MHVCILIALAFAAVTAVPTNPQRIIGGSLTTIQAYPSMAALLYTPDWNNFFQSCGGTIINNRSILTAAHCVHGDAVGKWRARVGSSFASSGGVVHNTASIIIHPNFNNSTRNSDIAILRVTPTFTFSNAIQPALVAGPNYNIVDWNVVWAAGWGRISPSGPQSEQLRHVQFWVVNQAACSARYGFIGMSVTANMVCTGLLDIGGRDTCAGDSGGPIYHNNVVVGVCSFGIQCGSAEFPGVNTRVSSFSNWVQSNA
ncbi:trypsin, alkaline A-like [Trichoplusia ni]|uniref:Trypsin, alkaline A-like n=1 Tax=Trichoplusia ni TaxID=7111 RepID=A0A7E5WEH1_TRINI|nr:trypsin, alkaline A-like [Trichoplusia ni]